MAPVVISRPTVSRAGLFWFDYACAKIRCTTEVESLEETLAQVREIDVEAFHLKTVKRLKVVSTAPSPRRQYGIVQPIRGTSLGSSMPLECSCKTAAAEWRPLADTNFVPAPLNADIVISRLDLVLSRNAGVKSHARCKSCPF
ncbi:hypothetical protein LIA77_04163 [Sarocladium implicatum]|nr:hypothetical protein LIA77_04163 [Sarocladium implicatum]